MNICVGFLLLAGLYVSSMSSCLAAMYGTPRVLQSIANENVIPVIQILGRGVSLIQDLKLLFFSACRFYRVLAMVSSD
jgi:hypothetical protein